MTGPTTRELIIRGARQHAERIAVISGGETRTFAVTPGEIRPDLDPLLTVD